MALASERRRRRRRKAPIIPAVWFRLRPGQPLEFWLRVRREAKARRVALRNLNAIREIANSMSP